MERITPNWSGNGSFSWWRRRRWKWRWNCCKFTPSYLPTNMMGRSTGFQVPETNPTNYWNEIWASGLQQLPIFKEFNKKGKIVFFKPIKDLLKTLKARISGTQIHHYRLPLSLLGHMVVCISLWLYNRTTTEISVSGTNNFLNTF